MSVQRKRVFSFAAVALLVSIEAAAAPEREPDLRNLLSRSKARMFVARLSGMPWRSFSAGAAPRTDLAELATATAYWVERGHPYDLPERMYLPRLAEEAPFTPTFSADPRRRFQLAIIYRAWGQMALAKALAGHPGSGAAMLDAAGMASDDAGMMSDAVALRIEQAGRSGDPALLLKALASADSLIARNRRLPEPRFNRGLALELLGLNGAAVKAYRQSLEFERDDGWREETTQRIARLSQQPSTTQRWTQERSSLELASHDGDLRTVARIVRAFPHRARLMTEEQYLGRWARAVQSGNVVEVTRNLNIARNIGNVLRDSFGDSLIVDAVRSIDNAGEPARTALARGHQLYEQAAQQRDRGEAAPAASLEEAARELDAAGSPMAGAARRLAVTLLSDDTPVAETLDRLRQVRQRTDPKYIALTALLDGDIANCLADRGDVYEAFETYGRAQSAFARLRDVEGATRMRSARARMLSLMGDPVEAWRIRAPALGIADQSGDAALLRYVIDEAATAETFEQTEWTAVALYEATGGVPPRYAPPAGYFGVNFARSPVNPRKETIAASIDGRPIPERLQTELHFAQAISMCKRQPRAAEALLSECIAASKNSGRVWMLPYIYSYRGFARRELHDEEGAIADLRQAISLIEDRARAIVRLDLRDLCLRTADDAFDMLAHIHWTRGELDQLFALGERRRGFIFLNGAGTSTTSMRSLDRQQISAQLQPGTAVVVVTCFVDHVLATVIESGRVVHHPVAERTFLVAEKRTSLRAAVQKGDQRTADLKARQLYELLIGPLGLSPARIQRLVIAADRPFQGLPFALLRDQRTRRLLFEDFELLHTPSASAFAQAKRDATPEKPRSVVTVGDPAFDPHSFPALPPLPAAAAQSRLVAKRYEAAQTLTGSKATLQNLARAVPEADVVDIAAHTARSTADPFVSDLLLAADGGGSGVSTLRDVMALQLKTGSTVVIGGCQTAIGFDTAGDLRDLASAFLAAGAGSAVGTLWDVDDDMTREFALRFHDALKDRTAAGATRAAQLAMLRSPDPRLRDPKAWSGFQVYTLGP